MPEAIQQASEAISEELKDVVIARLNLIPNNVTMSVGVDGADKEFTREELIESVKQENTVGLEVIRSQFEFLKALSTGRLLDDLLLEPLS